MALKNDQLYIYVLQILFACGLAFGSNFETMHKWPTIICRFFVYVILTKSLQGLSYLAYNNFQKGNKLDVLKEIHQCKIYLIIFTASVAYLIYTKERILGEDFVLLFFVILVTRYPEMEQESKTINYGVGMACSYFEGYLAHIIPSDGARFVGFEENINIYEAKQGVVFPVKRLFIVITKSLYCPPDLKQFNKKNKKIPYLEACQSLEDVEKDVAGVKNRTYRNSAYKIYRPGLPPVYLTAECATPLHTLHRVLEKKALYEELSDVDPQEIVSDFCEMLRKVIKKSPDCQDKCELVYYDDPSQNLADVLLAKIKDIEPDFENIITSEAQ
ncbi:stimulator of interferon genes protein-like [Melitaea cinxia]|uniref:stimulator of interferon genes protein-like n=1 Tax=Melitaea cinxia TaxID=113334 RepID=UPI001E270E86|nr:stimulator of interferon genes protein-like [Melitaea cinxia]